MNNPQEAMNQLIEHINSGAHMDISPGVHVTGLVEDQNSEKNIGLNQALFSTSIPGIDVIVRLTSPISFPPDFFLVANEDLDSDKFSAYGDLALAELIGKKIKLHFPDGNTTIFSTVDSVMRSDHDLIIEDGVQSISIYCIKFSDENMIASIGFELKDHIFVYDESNQDFVAVSDFLESWS